MNPYYLTLACLFVALSCQVTFSGLALQCWLDKAQPESRRRMWLAFCLAGLFLGVQNAHQLELAVRSGLFDLRQALFAVLAGLLAIYAQLLLRRQWS